MVEVLEEGEAEAVKELVDQPTVSAPNAGIRYPICEAHRVFPRAVQNVDRP